MDDTVTLYISGNTYDEIRGIAEKELAAFYGDRLYRITSIDCTKTTPEMYAEHVYEARVEAVRLKRMEEA